MKKSRRLTNPLSIIQITATEIQKNKQNKELAELKKHLFDISPINSVPKIIHETKEHQISDEIKNSDTKTSSSSSDSSNSDDNDLTKQQKKALHIKTKNVKKKSPFTSKQTFEKKAFTLAAKMIKNAAQIKFQAFKLDTDPKSTRLTFMYFIEDLSNLLDMFHQTSNILAKYPEVNYPSKKYLYAKKSLFTLINSYSNSEVKRIIKDTYGDGCRALQLLQS